MKSNFLKSRILVRFKVAEDGTVANPTVPVHLDTDDPELIKEAIRVASMMPKWKPAVKNGSPVAAEYLYPIINGGDSMRMANKIFLEGVRLFEQTDVQGALERFTHVLQINENDDDAHYNRGVCYFKLKEDDKACLDWSQPSLRCQISVVELLNKYCNANISLDSIPTIKEAGQTIYTIVEEMPTYQGGEKAMLDYIAQNIIYPVVAKKNRVTGRVYVSFVVDKDGNVREAKILRGIGGGCDEEALRVVEAMPPWNAGFHKGRPVNVQYNLPIHFTLN
jgi:TonB family protein